MNKSIIIAAMSILVSNAAMAENTDASRFSLGLTLGQVDFDLPKSSFAYGIKGAYQFDENIGIEGQYLAENIGIEGQYLATDGKEFTANNRRQDFDGQSYGLYGTYKYSLNNSPVYLKPKLGVSRTELDVVKIRDAKLIDTTVFQEKASIDKTSVSGGLEIGYKMGDRYNLELGYDYLNSDTDVINLGLNYKF